ncbi:expansin EXLX1 family cellulose-binding protein [Streptomyces sp. NBC_01077]|uniref:expansin EXLX1 family cellulose-binding protein n=1 Tax=Streptomyces sp. NBC_01077 TaxID=2903746 RepID=UPI0038647875|nr:expansin EXLX1 family cellulose-binding protein [Streptomyces sp. NBC_01077]
MTVLTAAGALIGLVVALRPGPTPDAGAATTVVPVAGTEATPTTAPSTSSATPTSISRAPATPTSTPTSASHAPATPRTTTAAAKPSPRVSSRTPGRAAPRTGRIQPHTPYKGVATAYKAADGDGACLFGPSDDLMVAAMNTTDYESSRACGAYVLVRASNGASITVRITNECPLPCAPGQLDLSEQAFAKLADLKVGRLPITWSLLSPDTLGPLSIRYKTGSSPYWCGIQVINHRNPVDRLEVRTAQGWRQLPRTDYNYFLSTDGSGCGSSIRVTDVYGERLTVDGIALKPDVAQPTRLQFAPR